MALIGNLLVRSTVTYWREAYASDSEKPCAAFDGGVARPGSPGAFGPGLAFSGACPTPGDLSSPVQYRAPPSGPHADATGARQRDARNDQLGVHVEQKQHPSFQISSRNESALAVTADH